MSVTDLKAGKPAADRAEEDAQVAGAVAATLKDIETRGDVAVRELANKFDRYDRETYRLTDAEIEEIIAQVTPQEMADLKFAQAQVRNFAQAQRDSMLDIEVESLPSLILDNINTLVQIDSCIVPDEKVSMAYSPHHSSPITLPAGCP